MGGESAVDNGDRASRGESRPSTFVLVGTPDVADSLGRNGFLARRLRASKPDALEPRIVVTAGLRSDIVAQRLEGGPAASAVPVPAGLEPWLESMFSDVELHDDTALIALSVSAALTEDVWRHRQLGLLVQPPHDHATSWNEEQRSWLASEFERVEASPDRIAESIRAVAAKAQEHDADLLVFNVSTYVPDQTIYYFKPGEDQPYALRAHALDLLVEQLAGEHGFFVLDVDRIVAELGAGEAVEGPGRYSSEALAVIGDEAASASMALPSVSLAYGAEVMQLVVPRYDRRTEAGVLEDWHVNAPTAIEPGDALFDVRFDHLHTRLAAQGRRDTGRSLRVAVVATQTGYLKEISARPGQRVEVGSRVGVVVKHQDIDADDVTDAGSFPVGVRVSGA